MYTHLGAGAYICGEESALLNSLEGQLGQPRVRPPFPANKGGGLYGEPTVVNNVETLANVPWIMVNGAAEYKKIGTEQSPGTKVFCLSGHVNKPGNYELPLGTTFRELIYEHGGGIPDGKAIKAILPLSSAALVKAWQASLAGAIPSSTSATRPVVEVLIGGVKLDAWTWVMVVAIARGLLMVSCGTLLR